MQSYSLFRMMTLALAAGLLQTVAMAAEQEFMGKVIEVIDGDTLKIVHDGKTDLVQLLNIDAPELAQPYGDKAKKFCEELCLGDQVRVVWEVRDDKGGIVATVHEQDGFNVNFEMVKAGMAWDNKALTHDRTLAELETDARKAKRGLWADRHPTPPWEFRKQHQKQPVAGGSPPVPRLGNGILPGPLRF